MTEEELIYTREDSSNIDDDKTIVVGNLPSCCEEDFIVNFFENRRQFGDGIEVIKVIIENDEAVVTFKNRSDVDVVLQRHAKIPCRLGQSELTIKSGDSSDTDEDSIVILDYYSHGSKELQPNYLQDTTLSLPEGSIRSIPSFDSGKLFGSGIDISSCINEQISELKLVLCTPSRDRVEHSMSLHELNPITISYVATTTASGLPAESGDNMSGNASSTPSRHTTLLQERLTKEFGRSVKYEMEDMVLVVTLCQEHEDINTIGDFEKAILALLGSFKSEIKFQLLEVETEEKLDFAVKHFQSFVHEMPQIKIYQTENVLSLIIVMQTENETQLVAMHNDIVKQKKVVEQEKTLSFIENFKIEACKKQIESQRARVIIQNGKIYIRGFQEDVLTATCFINKVLFTNYCESKELEDFAIALMKDSSIYKEVAKGLKEARFKVWFRVFGNSVFVVGNNQKHVKESAKYIGAFFAQAEIQLEEYMVDSMPLDRLKSRVKLEHPGSVFIDDRTRRPIVIVKSTVPVCRNVAHMLEDFKLRYSRIEKNVTLTGIKCEFVLQHLKKELEKDYEEEYLKVRLGADKVSLDIEGTEQSVRAFEETVKDVTTVKCWIPDEKFADCLKQMSLGKDAQRNKIVHVNEIQTQITIETGNIETKEADVIVNSTSEDLILNVGKGTVTQSISIAAGPETQRCLANVKKPVPLGSVVVGESGDLKCKKIFHVVLGAFCPSDKNTNIGTLGKVVKDCLVKASAREYVSIAFPALGTGIHGYPVEIVAQTLLDSVVEYIDENEKTKLKQIVIVFLDKDKEKRKVFERYKEKLQEELNKLKGQRIVVDTTPWPCRYNCHITAATRACACDFTQEIKEKLFEQTFRKY